MFMALAGVAVYLLCLDCVGTMVDTIFNIAGDLLV